MRGGSEMVSLKLLLPSVAYMVLWQTIVYPWLEIMYGIDWIPAELLAVVLLPVNIVALVAALLWWLAAAIIAIVILGLIAKVVKGVVSG